MENIHYDAMIQYAVPGVSKSVKFKSGEIMDLDGIYGFEFQNLIYSLLSIMDEKDQTYKSALAKIDEITEMIDKELMNK